MSKRHAMGWLWKSQEDEREHLLSTLQSLGPTTVAGLAAALSWSERKTERAVIRLEADSRIDLDFDATRRTVRLRPAAHPSPDPAPRPTVSPATPTPPARAAPPVEAPPLRKPPPAPLPRAWRTDVQCGTCHVPLEPTGTPSLAYCPSCGRLSKAPAAVATEKPVAPAPDPNPPVAVRPADPATVSTDDRRSQELFAQYVTSQRMPCPKCKTPLRHHGVGTYRCPACGHQVAFGKSGLPLPPKPPESPLPAQ